MAKLPLLRYINYYSLRAGRRLFNRRSTRTLWVSNNLTDQWPFSDNRTQRNCSPGNFSTMVEVLLFAFCAQVEWRSSMRLIWPIARMGFKPFGQTETQLPMLRQRKTLNGSCSFSSRSLVAVSRLSLRNRYA